MNADVTAGGNEDKDASLNFLSEKAATRSQGEESGNEGGAPLDARTEYLSYISGSPSSEIARHAPDYDRPQKLPFYKRRVTDLVPQAGMGKVPRLRHGLSTVLFTPGPQWLQEPRSGHWNFEQKLRDVPKVADFAFDRVSEFVTSSKDPELHRLAKEEGCIFAGSTSSLTGVLSQIYLLLSEEKPVNTSNLSAAFRRESRSFTPGQRMPVSIGLNYQDGVYATDSDVRHLGQEKSVTVLSQLGTMMEKFLTMSMKAFRRDFVSTSPGGPFVQSRAKDVYRQSLIVLEQYGKFAMRAQLDCRSPDLPGTGIFDIKTRAAVPIRYDLENYKDHLDYKIRTMQGDWESFEKEYYDLIRSAFLKYSFQARIGNMDGVFVAYHNTHETFGFQYIPLEEMDIRLFGHSQGHRIFYKCLGLLDAIFSEIVEYFPQKSVHCTWETRTIKKLGSVLHVWIEPKEWFGKIKPIVQLDINLTHYLANQRTSAHTAVGSVDKPCMSLSPLSVLIHANIGSLVQAAIRDNQHEAYKRQMLIYKFQLHPNEKVERGRDIDLTYIDESDANIAKDNSGVPESRSASTGGPVGKKEHKAKEERKGESKHAAAGAQKGETKRKLAEVPKGEQKTEAPTTDLSGHSSDAALDGRSECPSPLLHLLSEVIEGRVATSTPSGSTSNSSEDLVGPLPQPPESPSTVEPSSHSVLESTSGSSLDAHRALSATDTIHSDSASSPSSAISPSSGDASSSPKGPD
ncbi:predicted protein [Postia placenta Mad-698-R]|uniref:Pet127-domain-containing protein n=1 Tax=Postia placenta MAD-698-R-SB12 TaxID=670580 RepID=A0A1X6MUJ4_9APHY|nr:hypothetical protein POSPLADRAFT_1035400 [Postia placenta MAD-698-R-SB12]EED86069.1 predicted protein [Postia placenta Mad-698-R]OSX59896.1 hypothetical protein POSPLADRAFT_1035400 [Postia placenta MAD-698-R-SB12]